MAEKQKLLADLQAGRVPKLDRQLDLEEEAEEAPVLEFEVPRHKVKLMIGAGGERIKQIQRRTKTRIQVRGRPVARDRAVHVCVATCQHAAPCQHNARHEAAPAACARLHRRGRVSCD